MRNELLKATVVATAAVTLLGAGYFVRAEYQALTDFSRDVRSTYTQAAENPVEFANSYSTFSQSRQMESCVSMQLSLVGSLFPSPNRQGVANGCLARAEAILAQSPAESLAYVAKAASFANLGDYAAARENLAIARQIAPNEGWQAAYRAQLAFFIDRLDDSYLDESDADDLRLMLASNRQLDALASLFNRYSKRQDFIIAALENEPGDRQRRFLNRIRSSNTN